jgi:hypothetical protein
MGTPELEYSETEGAALAVQMSPDESTAIPHAPPVSPLLKFPPAGLAGEIGTPEFESSEIEQQLPPSPIQTFSELSIAMLVALLIPAPKKPPAGDNGVPELENSVTLETRLPDPYPIAALLVTQTLSAPSIAIAVGVFNPPPEKPLSPDRGVPEGESSKTLYESASRPPFTTQAFPELSIAILIREADSGLTVKPVDGERSAPRLENFETFALMEFAVQMFPSASTAKPHGPAGPRLLTKSATVKLSGAEERVGWNGGLGVIRG